MKKAVDLGIPLFGVCLGLQGIVEAFGGELGVLDYPMHGKPSVIHHSGRGVFEGMPKEFTVGRYHSLFAVRDRLPGCLEITAESEDGVIMGVRHRHLPIEAVQFHPESLLTATGELGLRLMRNALKLAQFLNRYDQTLRCFFPIHDWNALAQDEPRTLLLWPDGAPGALGHCGCR